MYTKASRVHRPGWLQPDHRNDHVKEAPALHTFQSE